MPRLSRALYHARRTLQSLTLSARDFEADRHEPANVDFSKFEKLTCLEVPLKLLVGKTIVRIATLLLSPLHEAIPLVPTPSPNPPFPSTFLTNTSSSQDRYPRFGILQFLPPNIEKLCLSATLAFAPGYGLELTNRNTELLVAFFNEKTPPASLGLVEVIVSPGSEPQQLQQWHASINEILRRRSSPRGRWRVTVVSD